LAETGIRLVGETTLAFCKKDLNQTEEKRDKKKEAKNESLISGGFKLNHSKTKLAQHICEHCRVCIPEKKKACKPAQNTNNVSLRTVLESTKGNHKQCETVEMIVATLTQY